MSMVFIHVGGLFWRLLETNLQAAGGDHVASSCGQVRLVSSCGCGRASLGLIAVLWQSHGVSGYHKPIYTIHVF